MEWQELSYLCWNFDWLDLVHDTIHFKYLKVFMSVHVSVYMCECGHINTTRTCVVTKTFLRHISSSSLLHM